MLDNLENRLINSSRYYNSYRVNVPEGVSGDWKVKKFEIKMDIELLRMVRDGRGCAPGIYTGLYHKGEGVVMSDTDAEIQDFLPYVKQMYGSILVTGLGIGCVLQFLIKKENVTNITVIEHSEDVIKLVADHYINDKVEIIHGDAFTWKPPTGMKYDWGWHDIWTAPSTDDLKDMSKLKKRYARYMNGAGRQYCWSEDWIRKNY